MRLPLIFSVAAVCAACSSSSDRVDVDRSSAIQMAVAEARPVSISAPSFGDLDPFDWTGRKPTSHPVHGIDVSRWQGEIDWAAARDSGVSFAYIKATEGGDVEDPMFMTNWIAAAVAGVPRGAYHYYYFCRSPEQQARWFFDHVPRDPSALPPVLDMEWNHQSRTCPVRPDGSEVRAQAKKHFGALPAPLTVLEERTVGPGLGADSIAAGEIASIIGLVAVVVFMVLCYGLFGVMASVALFFNLALVIAALSLLQATLTLPGIAGIVLTVGMAVDANVLIFERIREEIANGRSPISAIDSGYARALTTIVDSNLTTLIAGVLLFAMGAGPVRGFAVTLSIGIVSSMFAGIMVTRLMVVTWLRRTKPKSIPI